MIIPASSIDADTLVRIAEEYVTRDGTDYGEIELELGAKVEALLRKIQKRDVLIVFDEELEAVNLISKEVYEQSK